jgi:hypothetical protein
MKRQAVLILSAIVLQHPAIGHAQATIEGQVDLPKDAFCTGADRALRNRKQSRVWRLLIRRAR